MKDYIRIFGKKIKRSSIVYQTISFISRYGSVIGPLLASSKFEITKIEIPISGLPKKLQGLSLLHLSDIHAGEYIRKDFVEQVVLISNSLDPDIVFITGDFTEVDPSHIEWCAETLSQLSNHSGIYGVLGNHDIWNGDDFITNTLQKHGIQILRNQNISQTIFDEKIYISGIDDYKFGETNLSKAFDGIPDDKLHIFLSHHPDVVEKLDNSSVDLMLAGHIHGGQWNLPLVGVLYIPSKFGEKHAWGLSKHQNTYIYTSRGIGSTSIPLRINCPPEITLIILTAAEENYNT
jgi:predicted MPP superfamily phosphohydrolase